MLVETTGIHARVKKKGHVPKFTRGIHPRNQIYHHPQRDQIEIEIALKRYPSHVLAKKYGVNPGAIRRYRTKNMSEDYIHRIRSSEHIDPDLYGSMDDVIKYKGSIIEMIDRVQTEQIALIALKSDAMKDKAYQAAGQLAAEIRKNMELEARLKGFLEVRGPGRGVTINNNNVLVDAEPKEPEPDLSTLSVDELETLIELRAKIDAANKPMKVIEHVR